MNPLLFLKPIGKLLFNPYTWVLIAVIGSVYMAYTWAYDRGYEAQGKILKPQVASLTVKLDAANDKLAKAREDLETQRLSHKAATEFLEASQKRALQEQGERLDKLAKSEKILKGKLDVLSRQLITATADAACTIPRGFVRLHNASAEGGLTELGATAGGTTGTAAISNSGYPDANAPSGVNLSTVGGVIASNYTEARIRLEVIQEWQTWYATAFAAWKRAVQLQGYVPVVIPEPVK